MVEDNIVQKIKRWKLKFKRPIERHQLKDLKHAGKMKFWKI